MIIDWISYTVNLSDMVEWIDNRNEIDNHYTAMRVVRMRATDTFRLLYDPYPMRSKSPRPPYSMAFGTDYMTVYASPGLGHALIEISGSGCQVLRGHSATEHILLQHGARATRIDIAADIPDVTPDEVIESGYSSRFRSITRADSDTGTTVYVGSRKSERYARVYRYKPPHPRADLCRVELVFRKNYARAVADEIVVDGLELTCKRAMATYEWEHPALQQDAVDKLSGRSINKKMSNTERWLIKQAAPAFRRLCADGHIDDPVAWLRQHFTP